MATTTSSGAAVSSSSATAVQSVYIACKLSGGDHHLSATCVASMTRWCVPLLVLLAAALPARAGVDFTDCQPASGGGVTCNTEPTGNTLMDDEDSRYGLFNEASPGWNEYDPYEGYDDMFGGNWT